MNLRETFEEGYQRGKVIKELEYELKHLSDESRREYLEGVLHNTNVEINEWRKCLGEYPMTLELLHRISYSN